MNSNIDIFIPTFNEATHIVDAVNNAKQVGNVYVLDSCSTDDTQQLARDAGATVIEHAWEGYARQKNWGLGNLPMTGQWVFILDADERIMPKLREELFKVVANPNAATGYYVNRLLLFMGKPIRHGGLYPSWNLRFFKRGMARYEDRSVHEHMVCDGPTEYMRHQMLHVRCESMTQYIDKHIRYADLESDEWVKQATGQSQVAQTDQLFRDMLRYRQWVRRHIWPHTPFRPLLRFIYMYIFRLGILDGRPGLSLANLMANYEYMISLLYRDKMVRLREQENDSH
jgi:glycosyltransferase involved in cell wall biosynthesis